MAAVATSEKDRADAHPWISQNAAPFAGKYTVERILGQGGMGVVFAARHIRVGQRVAIKVLGSELRQYPELVERFEREARACGALSSRHAVRVFDIDATDDGTPFLVMELLAGRDLSRIVESDGPQPLARSVRWLIEACDAISEAHRLGIIHRDIKPSNLFLTDVDGQTVVKVLDFGIAKRVAAQEVAITQAIAPLGTPQYMSPEQIRCSKDVDARTDVWSLGVTLYELVTGQTPFAHESSSACIASIVADPVPDPRTIRPELPEAFVSALMRALEKNARNRYQSVEELVAAIAPFAISEGDEEESSAVRRAMPSLQKTPHDQATLDGAAAGLRASSPPSPVGLDGGVPFRGLAESSSDRTVPPAISLASAPPKRRFRSSLAVAAATVLGLASIFLTPRCASHGIDATKPSMYAAATQPQAPSSPAPVFEVAAPAAESVPSAVAPSAVATTPVAEAAVVRVVRTDITPPSQPQLRAGRVAKSEKLAPPAPRPDVHGGLSNPGF